MNTIQHSFEQVPSIVENEWQAGFVDGVAEISYSDDGVWYVSALSVEHDNGKIGPAAKSKLISVSRAYQGPLWSALTHSLETFCKSHIQDAVDAALLDNAVQSTQASGEHRLRSWQLV